MQELTFEQVEVVSGGALINPVSVMLVVKAGQIAAPYVVSAAKIITITAVTTAAGIAGYNAGSK